MFRVISATGSEHMMSEEEMVIAISSWGTTSLVASNTSH